MKLRIAIAAAMLIAARQDARQDWKLADDAGTIKGTVKLDGKAPRMGTIIMDSDKYCENCHAGAIVHKETVIVDANGGLKNCIVFVKSGLEKYKFPVPTKAAELNQDGCMYDPHVQCMMAGQKIKLINSDATCHNIHPQPKVNGEWNVNQPNQGDVAEKEFAVAEWPPIFVKCDVHDWMGAYIAVFDHPFFAVTAAGGAFTLPKLNPGEYEIEVWHEKYGCQTKKVVVKSSGAETLDFAFKVK